MKEMIDYVIWEQVTNEMDNAILAQVSNSLRGRVDNILLEVIYRREIDVWLNIRAEIHAKENDFL
jgi:hypothetical protein